MRVGIVLGGLLALGATQAMAADWSFDPRVAADYVFNDNYRLDDQGDEIEVSGASLDARFGIRGETQRSLFELTPRLRSTFFPGDDEQEANDQFVRMFARHLTERTVTSFAADFSSVETLGDYFPIATVSDDDVLGDPDRGVGVGQAANNREDRLALKPRLTYDLTERQQLDLEAEYLDVSHDFQVPGDRVDFENRLIAVGYRFLLSESSSVVVRAALATYDPSDEESTDAQGLNVEWRNEVSDTAEVYVRGGANRVETMSTGGGSSWDTGFAGGAGVRWAFEVSDVWLDASTSLDPSSTGDIVTRDQLRAQFTRRLGPMTRMTLSGRLIRDSGAGDAQDDFSDRTYATGRIGLNWQFARQWSLSGSYAYASREYDDAGTDAQSNAFNLGVIWEPKRR